MSGYCGLDLSSLINGYCVGDGDQIPLANAWFFPDVGGDLGKLIDLLDKAFLALVEEHRITEVVYEAPILKRHDTLLKLRKLYSIGPHIEWRCRQKGIRCQEEDLRTLKKVLTGNHAAEKEDMVAAATRVGLYLPIGHGEKDAADAFAAWLCLLRARDRDLFARWDQLLRKSRGGLC